jgi:glycosyltransferase involved in cell wall biosynthesis
MVNIGGAERMTFEVLRTVIRADGSVMCVVNDWENHRIAALATEIGAQFIPGPYHQALKRKNVRPSDLLRMSGAILRCSSRLLVVAARFKPTHVLIPEIFSLTVNGPALLALRAAGVRVIYQMHDTPPQLSSYQRFWRLIGTRLVDQFVCVSKFVAEELRATGVSPAKISRIYNTLPTRRATPAASGARELQRIVYVGQFLPGKGLDVLLEAVALLVARGYDVRLSVIGNAFDWIAPAYESYRKRLLERARRPDLAGRVDFLGSRDDVLSVMASAGVHCCPSLPEIREAFGLVVLEAKVSGLPSVIFPSGGLPELIEDRVDGWISTEISAEGLAEGLEYFIADPKRTLMAGELARKSAERFSLAQFRSEWERVFGLVPEKVGAQGRAG